MLTLQQPRILPQIKRVPAHAAALPGGQWRVWRTAALRGAGFSCALPGALSGDNASAAADRLLSIDARVRELQAAALREFAASGEPPTREELRANRALRRKLRKGHARADGTESERALATALDHRAAAHASFFAAYEADVADGEERLRAIAADPRLHEALLWQNLRGVRVALKRVAERHGAPREIRQAAEYLAMHLQRYCLKNDTVGFFGPGGWASIVDAPHAVSVTAGPELVSSREVFFEGWPIDALADALDALPGVRPWAAPRRKAGVWLDGERVYAPLAGLVSLTFDERTVLAACDGVRSATELARALIASAANSFLDGAEVFAILQRLVSRNLITWRFEVTPQLRPDRDLAARIDRIEDADVRAACRRPFDELIGARDAIAAAAGQPEALEVRLAALDETFTRLTGLAPTRRAGETYAARALVYEDCCRDCDVTLGAEFLERLGPPLSIVLDGARWVAGEMAHAANRYFRRCHAELRKPGASAVDGHVFFSYLKSQAAESIPLLTAPVASVFQQRWQTVLGLDYTERRCRRSIAETAARGRVAFDRARRSWSQASYISPDVMVSARDRAAFARGDFHCVLGEVHGLNTIMSSALFSQHPRPEEAIAALAADTRDEIYVQIQKSRQEWLARANALAVAPTFWRYEFGDDPSSLPAIQPLPAAKLDAVDDGDIVRMRARDGSIEFDAIELFGDALSVELHKVIASWLPDVPHVPRTTVGDLTIVRERWLITPGSIQWPQGSERADVFLAIRRWAAACGMPRYVFYKSPRERKPCYLDFDSPMYVHLFAKMLRALEPGAVVRIVEMLPCADETWLVDCHGTHYTSEIRLVARRH